MVALPRNVTLWSYRRIPYEFEAGFPYQDDVREAMDKWQGAAGVTFVPRRNEANYVILRQPPPGSGSGTAIGMQEGAQIVFINAGYKALHELGHTLGLVHEQSRSDRNQKIDMIWEDIVGGEDNTDFRLERSSQNLTDYDLASVMHYPAPATGWGGISPDGWTMRWKDDRSKPLGAGHYQGWSDLSALDQNPYGLRAKYDMVLVPMGPEIAHGFWKFPYAVQFPFSIGGRQFFYGQNMDERNWFIQELLPDGAMGPETDHGTWKFAYAVQFAFKIDGRVFFYGQNVNERNWFIQELQAGGKIGAQTDNGTWDFAYGVQFPFEIGRRVFFYGQNTNEMNWFIQELLVGGKMGVQTDNGTWNSAYRVQFSYSISGKQYFYGQNLENNYWFIQRLLEGGKMGDELQGGFWAYPYGAQFPFSVEGQQYFYGQKITSGYNWFIQRLVNV